MRSGKILPGLLIALLMATTVSATPAISQKKQTRQAKPAADSIAGWYEGVAKSSAADKNGTLITVQIQNDKGKLSGNIEAPQGTLPFTGEYGGDRVTMTFNPGQKITLSATFTGDAITGTWDMEGTKGVIELKKISPELAEMKAMIRQAQTEIDQFGKSGGKPSDENHPSRKWATSLFQYSKAHRGTPEAERAQTEALLMLLRSERIAEASAQAYRWKPDGSLWERAVKTLLDTVQKRGELDSFINNGEALVAGSKDSQLQSSILSKLGLAYWRKGNVEKAKSLFQRIIKEYPHTPEVEFAKGNVYEFEHLNVGQISPAFSANLTDGQAVSLAAFKGKPVLLVYWASW